MDHLRLRHAVEAYVDGELTGDRRAQMAAHLAHCWACSGYAQTLYLIKTSLRRGLNHSPTSLSAFRLRRFCDGLAAGPRLSGGGLLGGPAHDVRDGGRPKG